MALEVALEFDLVGAGRTGFGNIDGKAHETRRGEAEITDSVNGLALV